VLVLSRGWSFYVCFMAIVSTNGLAWGQVGNTFNEEPGKSFLQPYSPANNYQSLDDSDKTINNNTNKPKNGGATTNKVMLTPTKKSAKSTFGQHPKSKIQLASPEIGAAGSSLGFQEYNQSSSAGSGSFLDGYLLRSLHEKKIEGKKGANDNTSDENLPKKKRDSFIK
jgi:hypothetical protein